MSSKKWKMFHVSHTHIHMRIAHTCDHEMFKVHPIREVCYELAPRLLRHNDKPQNEEKTISECVHVPWLNAPVNRLLVYKQISIVNDCLPQLCEGLFEFRVPRVATKNWINLMNFTRVHLHWFSRSSLLFTVQIELKGTRLQKCWM